MSRFEDLDKIHQDRVQSYTEFQVEFFNVIRPIIHGLSVSLMNKHKLDMITTVSQMVEVFEDFNAYSKTAINRVKKGLSNDKQ